MYSNSLLLVAYNESRKNYITHVRNVCQRRFLSHKQVIITSQSPADPVIFTTKARTISPHIIKETKQNMEMDDNIILRKASMMKQTGNARKENWEKGR